MRAKQEERDVLGPILQKAREDRDIRAEDLAERFEIGTRHLSSIENNHGKPSCWILFHMIRFFGIDANSIFYPEQNFFSDNRQMLFNRIKSCDGRTNAYLLTVLDAIQKFVDDGDK